MQSTTIKFKVKSLKFYHAKAISFKKRFVEMAVISLTVAVISFGIGLLIKNVFQVEV